MIEQWMTALAGGVLLGLAATLQLWLNGRIAGISGILGSVLLAKTATPRGGRHSSWG